MLLAFEMLPGGSPIAAAMLAGMKLSEGQYAEAAAHGIVVGSYLLKPGKELIVGAVKGAQAGKLVGAAPDIALGLRTIGDAPVLRQFARKVGAVAGEDWARLGLHNAPEGRFDLAFQQTLNNIVSRGGRIKFNLDGLDIGKALLGNPAERVGRYTEWELQQIM